MGMLAEFADLQPRKSFDLTFGCSLFGYFAFANLLVFSQF